MNAFKKLIAFLLFALISTSAFAVTNDQLFAYAEANYASFFAGTASSGQYQQYNYRYYPATGNYLAVDTSGTIFVLGPISNGIITSVGTLSSFGSVITDWEATNNATPPVEITWNLLPSSSLFWIPSLDVARNLNNQWVLAGFQKLLTINGDMVNDTITIPTTGWIYSVTYGKGLYVGVGSSNTIITSPNATNWTSRISAFTISWGTINSIAFGNGIFVAVANGNSSYGTSTEQIQTSTDGITWNAVDILPITLSRNGSTYPPSFSSVTFGNGQFVAVGSEPYGNDAGIYTSTDGITWVKQNSGLAVGNSLSLTSVKFAGGLYVALGWGGLVMTSPDGVTWIKRTAATQKVLRDVAYGNGKYVAVGDTGTMIESNDGGITWAALPALTTYRLNSIDFANNEFVVAGEYVIIVSQ